MNYIVSGLERSGTSLMMQVLQAGGVPVAYDNSRMADYHNPKGYYELEGGKVIRSLIDGKFPLQNYQNTFIKITAYGIKFLPAGEYRIIYMVRDIDEILDSTEKMVGQIDREKERLLLDKLNEYIIVLMNSRDDIKYLKVNHRDIMIRPRQEMSRVARFLDGLFRFDINHSLTAIEPSLYRNRQD